jgi:hypothetical protein
MDSKPDDLDIKQKKWIEKVAQAEEQLRKSGLQKCPHCRTWCVKISGCHFIYCSSSQCRTKQYFCYLCGCKLTEAQHFSHFSGMPYGDSCLGPNDQATTDKLDS